VTATIAVVGALDVTLGDDGAQRANGDALVIALVATRLGLETSLVVHCASEVVADVRGPLVAEGLELEVLDELETEGDVDHVRLVGDAALAVRHAARREALVCVAGDGATTAALVLREADPRRTLRVLCFEPRSRLDTSALRECDLLIVDLEVARTWCTTIDDGVSARGLARRLFAFGPRRVVVLDRVGSSSVAFDGTLMHAIPFGLEQRQPSANAVFTAALVARLLVGDRLRAAIAVAVRCARLRAATSSTFPDLPTPQDFESFATRPGAASAPKKERP
jgi:hypothetical protein